jgi:glycosyltransferase involved in cell wall biosynthesis
MTSQNHDKTVSIVMCTFNGERFLKDQLESILHQTWPYKELIISDDGSTDKTLDIIRDYMRNEDRIKLFVNQSRLGPNKNFEKAFQLASGDCIAAADQDDIWDIHKTEIIMKNWPPDTSFIFSLPGRMSEDSGFRMDASKVRYSDIDSTFSLVFNTPVNGHASMFRKEFLKECLPFPQDVYWDWWMSMHAASLGKITCVKKTLTWQRIHTTNFSRDVHFITEKEERERRKRERWVYFIRKFFEGGRGREPERKALLQYASILETMDGKTFSDAMYRFVLKYRKKIFHYKKKPFVIISHLKHAARMAKSGTI